MAQTFAEKFIKEGTVKSFDEQHRHIINRNLDNYETAFKRGTDKFFDLGNSKKKAHLIKWKAIENLDRYLLDFEANFTKRGGKVIWANDAAEAREEIARILDTHQARSVVMAQSTLADEINLDTLLAEKKIAGTSTDLGRFITEHLQQKPSHFASPAIHLDAAAIAKLFHEQFDTPPDATIEQLTAKASELLRDEHRLADVGITGVNFLLADVGSVSITENEGNARLAATFPKVHIAIAGIEQIVPSLHDLDLFWPLLSSHRTGQHVNTYNSIISGPCQAHETDGPEEMYVVLLDNGRSNVLTKKEQRQALYCIRCGACLNACPVYRNVGGDAYQSVYQGPIGSVIMPHIGGMKNFGHLSYATPLSGKPTDVCPTSIDLRKLLLLNRKEAVEQQLISATEKRFWKAFTYTALRRKVLDFFTGRMKNLIVKTLLSKAWGKQRQLPLVAEKSFSKRWREQEKNR
ncbi:LUD domain-containing protein [Sphingobacterium oryzagri]|uniref:LUD domain-containing protein n=1 Tax=Sphingobacterium oryzagri TaxID=3025669 RepID=A0ABY7WHR2_9SPHI|nr:LUD domain-containing protein [Sphingobacterium sp. KACC 22765]WDF67918.1 LUD domain-containing protein [Sphingobacterium sp. KACC 22765]